MTNYTYEQWMKLHDGDVGRLNDKAAELRRIADVSDENHHHLAAAHARIAYLEAAFERVGELLKNDPGFATLRRAA